MTVKFGNERKTGIEIVLKFGENFGIVGPEALHDLRRDDDFRLKRLLVGGGFLKQRRKMTLHLD
jgi:hypothetical protein